MKITELWIAARTRQIVLPVAVLFGCILANYASADDWGAYAIVPASAPGLVLEAVGSGMTDGTLVAIDRPNGRANQKWIIVPKGGNFFAIKPSHTTDLVLSVAKGGAVNGTSIVLETDKGQPWQAWALKKNDNGTYCLIPKHAPDKGLDDLGGNQKPGTKQDLWENHPGDEHLQWRIKPLAGTFPDPSSAPENGAPPYVPPDLKPEDIPKGEVKFTTFNRSLIFPGTIRQVAVFIPAQYKRTPGIHNAPACVYVKTDGYNPREKELLESLIAAKEMPVTIGVFVTPGEVPAPVKGTLGRRNRDFEYDALGDNNARFLVDEILPFVAREFNLELSPSGDDRCIAGGSSGGIAAFAAAWERPNAFSRVYANSGSFTAFRGGHEFPTLVRKYEAKPIRAYLTTGTHDMENVAGDWFLLDQEMDKALRFSGYDYFFRIINGGHVAGYYDYFQEAMHFLWKDWPKPVQAGPSAPRVRDVILPDQTWEPVRWKEAQPKTMSVKSAVYGADIRGAACNAAGELFFVDANANVVYRMDLDGKVTRFLADAGQANSLSFGADGQLYTVSDTTGKIMRYDPAGKGSLVLAGIRGETILTMPDGGLYVTSDKDAALIPGTASQPPRLLGVDREDAATPGTVWYIKNGKKTAVASGLKLATGLAYRPDQWLLAVADGRSKWAYSYQINPDGTLTNKERFFWLHVRDWEDEAGAQSVCYAREGQMLVATRAGIQICADDGPTQVILPMPDGSRVTRICLGGRDFDMLYAFSNGNIWKRKVKIHGMGAFTPWIPVHGTPL